MSHQTPDSDLARCTAIAVIIVSIALAGAMILTGDGIAGGALAAAVLALAGQTTR